VKGIFESGLQLRRIANSPEHQCKSARRAKSKFPFKGNGSSIIVKPQWKDGKVYINKENYYDNVPEEVWQYYIGGYQIAEKWLKDRKDTELDFIHHFRH
jgi:hypothetical protein